VRVGGALDSDLVENGQGDHWEKKKGYKYLCPNGHSKSRQCHAC